MVTVLVFAVPAFAIGPEGSLPKASDPSGLGGIQPPKAGGIEDVELRADNPPPENIGGELEEPSADRHDPQTPEAEVSLTQREA